MQTYGRYRRWGLLTNVSPNYATLARDRFIIGDAAQVIDDIQRYRKLVGTTYLIGRMATPPLSHDQIARCMRLFCERVAPNFSPES